MKKRMGMVCLLLSLLFCSYSNYVSAEYVHVFFSKVDPKNGFLVLRGDLDVYTDFANIKSSPVEYNNTSWKRYIVPVIWNGEYTKYIFLNRANNPTVWFVYYVKSTSPYAKRDDWDNIGMEELFAASEEQFDVLEPCRIRHYNFDYSKVDFVLHPYVIILFKTLEYMEAGVDVEKAPLLTY
ncbi:hypothetical protein [Selenomonas sp. AE3005]|uniref:hypothetical protein n=1 Tax=Selenomonas sp. AE3005 TaxID=1485543 RepID=UPI0025FFB636|nr:hypothetical protein [Selenomonas sp. AE3005]